eukprot:7075861-Pyramimonas_sp.AAC.1
MSSGGTSYADHHETSPSHGGTANCETVATPVGSLGAQRKYVPRRSPRDLAAPWGAVICETVATVVSSWEAQR